MIQSSTSVGLSFIDANTKEDIQLNKLKDPIIFRIAKNPTQPDPEFTFIDPSFNPNISKSVGFVLSQINTIQLNSSLYIDLSPLSINVGYFLWVK